MKTLKLRSEREQVVELCQRMDADGLTVGTSGNISLRDPVTGLIAVSPSGLPYGEMAVEDVVVVDIEGNVVEGGRKPSSETDMHRLVYVAQPEITLKKNSGRASVSERAAVVARYRGRGATCTSRTRATV